MKHSWIALGIGILTFHLPVYATTGDSPISSKQLREEVSKFIGASRPNRSVGSPGHAAAESYLIQQFKAIAQSAALAGKVYVHEFTPDVEFAASSYRRDFETQVEGKIPPDNPDYMKWKSFTEQAISFVRIYQGKKGKNLILELTGSKKPSEIVYVGAHFDTITHDKVKMQFTPEKKTDGADDNASGIAALLQSARNIAKTQHDRTIRFIAFDYEEIFFLGAYAFAKDLSQRKVPWESKDEEILGLFNLEMIGNSHSPISKKPIVKLYIRSPDKDTQATSDLKLATFFAETAKQLKTKINPVILKNGFDRSDHWSFWQMKIPAVCISQDWEGDFNEKNYHTDHDSIESLNMDYLSEITKTLFGTLVITGKSKEK